MKLSQNLGKISLGELGWLEIKQAPLCGGFTLRRVGREPRFFFPFFLFLFGCLNAGAWFILNFYNFSFSFLLGLIEKTRFFIQRDGQLGW